MTITLEVSDAVAAELRDMVNTTYGVNLAAPQACKQVARRLLRDWYVNKKREALRAQVQNDSAPVDVAEAGIT